MSGHGWADAILHARSGTGQQAAALIALAGLKSPEELNDEGMAVGGAKFFGKTCNKMTHRWIFDLVS